MICIKEKTVNSSSYFEKINSENISKKYSPNIHLIESPLLEVAERAVTFCQFDDKPLGDLTPQINEVYNKMLNLKKNEFLCVYNEDGENKNLQKGTIVGSFGKSWIAEPITSKGQGGFATVLLTDHLALRFFKNQDNSNSNFIDNSRSIINQINPNGTTPGIIAPSIGFAQNFYNIRTQEWTNNEVKYEINKRYKSDALQANFPTSKLSSICINLVLGIRTLHKAGIYHLDIKPSNILCDEEFAYLADFDGAVKSYKSPILFTPSMVYQKDMIDLLKIRQELNNPSSILSNEDFEALEKEFHEILSFMDIFALGSTFYQLGCLAKTGTIYLPYNYASYSSQLIKLLNNSSESSSFLDSSEDSDASFPVNDEHPSSVETNCTISSAPKSYFAGDLIEEELRKNLEFVYTPTQIDMILQMLQGSREKRPTISEILQAFSKKP